MKLIKKIIPAVLVFAALLCGCGSNGGSAESKVDLKAVFEAACAADTTLPEMTTVSSDADDAELNFTLLCDFEYDRVDSYYYAYATDGSAPEVAVVRVKESGDAAALMSKIKNHVADRRGAMESYSPEQVEAVDKYVLVREGDAILYAIGEKNGLAAEAFKKALGVE